MPPSFRFTPPPVTDPHIYENIGHFESPSRVSLFMLRKNSEMFDSYWPRCPQIGKSLQFKRRS